jgi:hypothetical protein
MNNAPKTKVWLAILIGALSLIGPHAALAGGINGQVVKILGTTDNNRPILLVYTTSTFQAQPACTSGSGGPQMIVPVDTDAGREMATIAKIAYFTGMTVTIYGTGACSIDPGLETAATVVSP